MTPLLLETGPPSITRQRTSWPVDGDDLDGDLAVVDQQPVARPARPAAARCTCVETRSAVPSTSSVVMVTCRRSPARPGPSANVPSRIFGPWRSASTPTARPVASDACADPAVGRVVVGVGAVAEVQPGDVHAGVDERADRASGDGRRDRACRRSSRGAVTPDSLGAAGRRARGGRRSARERRPPALEGGGDTSRAAPRRARSRCPRRRSRCGRSSPRRCAWWSPSARWAGAARTCTCRRAGTRGHGCWPVGAARSRAPARVRPRRCALSACRTG